MTCGIRAQIMTVFRLKLPEPGDVQLACGGVTTRHHQSDVYAGKAASENGALSGPDLGYLRGELKSTLDRLFSLGNVFI